MFKFVFSLIVIFTFAIFEVKGQGNKKKDAVITLSTSFGEMTILLYDETPLHKNNFLKLAREGYYNGTTFHRIIKDFMIQGGDPNSKDSISENDGLGGPGYTIPIEVLPTIRHSFGAIAAARLGDNINPSKASNGSQFYIVENPAGTPFLDNSYTVFGKVILGHDVITKISGQPKDFKDRPIENIAMKISIKEMKRKKIVKKFNCPEFYKL